MMCFCAHLWSDRTPKSTPLPSHSKQTNMKMLYPYVKVVWPSLTLLCQDNNRYWHCFASTFKFALNLQMCLPVIQRQQQSPVHDFATEWENGGPLTDASNALLPYAELAFPHSVMQPPTSSTKRYSLGTVSPLPLQSLSTWTDQPFYSTYFSTAAGNNHCTCTKKNEGM